MNRQLATVLATTFCCLAAGALPAQNNRKANSSHLGKVLPDIDARGGTWINATTGVSLEDLRDGPTLVCFTFLG